MKYTKLFAIAAALMFATPVVAQQEFTLKVTPAEINVIGEALGFMPYSKAAPLIQKLQVQVNAQSQPPAPVEPAKEEPKKE